MTVKKTIFIGGTSYSGSTFFDMIIANDKNGFSCGEIEALFYPYRKHHINPGCSCGIQSCNIWNCVYLNGPRRIYDSLEKIGIDVSYLVDSSKNPFWIKDQMKILDKKNKEYRNLLIWKTPLEFAHSFKKRNRNNWEKYWIGYHLKYFALIKEWKAISYKDIINDKSKLKDVCDYIGINFYNGKEKYWKKTQHTLFGNNSAKIHLYSAEDDNYKKLGNDYIFKDKKIKKEIINQHRSLYYNKVNDDELKHEVDCIIDKNPIINKIISSLKRNDISNKRPTATVKKSIRRNIIVLQLQKIKYYLKTQMRKRKILISTFK